jgi:uncharacterized glyoxalase superfamily protein PhnB/alkylhydroperoxidase family enzyme
VEAEFARIESLGGDVPNMHLTFGRHPELYAAWLPFAVHLMPNSTLTPRHRQLLILRTSYAWRAHYPWAHHARISKAVSDLTDAEIAATARELGAHAWRSLKLALLRACDETRLHGAVEDETWQMLSSGLGERELMDVVFTIGQYGLIAAALTSLRVQLDPGFELPVWAVRDEEKKRMGDRSQQGVTFETVTPCLAYEDAAQALEWLERVLGFQERARYVDKEGVVRQAEIFVGDTEVFLSGHGAGYWDGRERGPEQYLVVWVDDVDAQWEAVKAAGVAAPAPTDQSWGVRNFYVSDPGGYHWGFHRRLPSGYRQVKSVEEGGLRELMKRATPSG